MTATASNIIKRDNTIRKGYVLKFRIQPDVATGINYRNNYPSNDIF